MRQSVKYCIEYNLKEVRKIKRKKKYLKINQKWPMEIGGNATNTIQIVPTRKMNRNYTNCISNIFLI